MLFLLTHTDYDVVTVKGVFTSVEKAKDFAEKQMGNSHKWSDPTHNIYGTIWANYLEIKRVALDPTDNTKVS